MTSPRDPVEDPSQIDLRAPLSLAACFRFPLQSAAARREVLIGAALLLLLPGVGWVLNMGHRIVVVHKMQHGEPAWPSWNRYGALLRHGATTLLGMAYYYLPALSCAAIARALESTVMWALAVLLASLATLAIPGFMSHYCRAFDPREIFDPARALSRCLQGGRAYWRAWAITLSALAISLTGLLALGIGFLVTSVWFWQVAGFAFATTFSQRFALYEPSPSGHRAAP